MEKVSSMEEVYSRMRLDYERGVFCNPAYEPFFAVRFYNASPRLLTKVVCHHILCETQRDLMALEEKHPFGHKQLMKPFFGNDLLRPFRGFGSDCFLYCYLVEIERQMVLLIFGQEVET